MKGERPPAKRYPGRLALSLFVQACFVVSVVAFDVGSMTRWTIIALSAVFAINAVRRYLTGR